MNGRPSPARALRLSARGYQALLGLYPAPFRMEYGEEMRAVFEQRWQAAYAASGWRGVGRWLLLTAGDGLRSAWMEHGETMAETMETSPEARGQIRLGALFLAGTWAALLGAAQTLAGGPSAGLLAGAALVVVNAGLVARSLTRSTHYAPVAGMAAMANLVLAAGLLAAAGAGDWVGGQAGAAGATLLGLGLAALQAAWLWKLRGEDFEPPAIENETGG